MSFWGALFNKCSSFYGKSGTRFNARIIEWIKSNGFQRDGKKVAIYGSDGSIWNGDKSISVNIHWREYIYSKAMKNQLEINFRLNAHSHWIFDWPQLVRHTSVINKLRTKSISNQKLENYKNGMEEKRVAGSIALGYF